MELDFDLTEEMEQEQVKKTSAKARTKQAQKKKEIAKFEPSWEQVWNGYDHENAKGEVKHKKGIWELKNTDSDLVWLREVKVAVESGELGLINPTTKEPIPMSKFSKARAKELFAVLEVMKREQRMKQIVDECPSNYYCIQDSEQMEKLVEYLKDEVETGLDSETTGLDVYMDNMVGISITLPKKDVHVYVPFGHTTGEKQLPKQYVLNKLRPYLYGDSKKYLHNAKFDRHMFIREGSDIKGFLFDSQIAMQVLNENEPSKRLKDLLTKYKYELGFKEDSWTFDQLFGKNAEFAKVPLDVATAYACKDTHGCYLLGKWQEKFLNAREGLQNIFYNVEAPLLPIVVDMERAGLLVDLEFGAQYGKELDEHLEGLMEQIKEELGDININSPAQLATVLYDDLGLEDISGKRGTGKDILKQLADEAPILNTLLEYRDLHKLNSTYISALPDKIKADKRLHGQFIQDRTATGRFASKEPNLQNLPPRARHMFVAPEGHVMVSIDFS